MDTFHSEVRMKKLSIRGALALPSPFQDLSVERAFRRRYLVSGLRLSRLAVLIGACLATAFWLLLAALVPEGGFTSARQLIRAWIAVVLATSAALLYLQPRLSLRNYSLIVGLPAALACAAIAGMGFLPFDAEHQRTARLATAMTVACWLAYGFTRLPTTLAASVCLLSSLITIIGAGLNEDEYLIALCVYLLVANIMGWAMSVGTERRERALFWSSLKLIVLARERDASAKLSAEANTAKSRLLAAVNHDLRQPLTSMTLYLALLEGEALKEGCEGQDSSIARIRECASAMMDNLSRLSDAPEGSHQEIAVVTAPTDLRQIFFRLRSVFQGQAEQLGLKLLIRLPMTGRYRVCSSEGRLWDALSNLVSNAIKYADRTRKGWVLVRATKVAKGIRITVSDNGIGIHEQFHGRVFDEHFQVPNAGRTGSGLGLTIVRETLCRLPGHYLKMRSLPGVGTRFDVFVPGLPLEGGAQFAPLLQNATSSPNCDAAHDPLLGSYVLVVDDDAPTRAALTKTMEGWGMLVESAGSPGEALETVRRAERLFDVVVSDFSLPGPIDGVALIEAVRNEQGCRTPAIVISGRVTAIDAARLRKLDLRAASKPLAPADLRSELVACMRV